MPQRERASVDLENELAIAFRQELGARVSRGGSSSKADMARTLIAEALRARGHDVDAPETQWGGHTRKEETSGQLAGVGAP